MQNELIVTGAASIAVIQLIDDSRMTLRPYSSFRVNRLEMADEGNDSSAVLNLLRGGLRLLSGLIGKANPAGYRLSTPVATIGIRGTEFNTRICSTDCAAEEIQLAGSDAAAEIEEGLYVNVDEGRIFMQNFAAGEPLEIQQGESGYVSDLNSLPEKLSFVPAFQSLDKIPSPSQLDFDDIQISDDALVENVPSAEIPGIAAASAPALAVPALAAAPASQEKAAVLDIAGEYETDRVKYGKDLPHSDRKWFFGSNPDLEFTLRQKGDKIEGEFEGDRDGVIKGKIDDEEVTFTFQLEARGGELKEGEGTWIVQEDGSLKGDFLIRDRQRGVVRGYWTLVKDD
ncbi:MAG: FecR family protein [Gammaproteobacteria bacterium]|nr:FecR family protein [Gammaproteobacteria bacterium]